MENHETVTIKHFCVTSDLASTEGVSIDIKNDSSIRPGDRLVVTGHGWQQPERGIRYYIHSCEVWRDTDCIGMVTFEHLKHAQLVADGTLDPQP